MTEAKPTPLRQELITLDWEKRLSQSLRELLVPFALCAVVVGIVWYLLSV
jgi:hypothetical protein